MAINSLPSVAEIEIMQEINKMVNISDEACITTHDAKRLIDCASKCLIKCKELRISRDNWREKFEKLKQEVAS